MPAAVTETEVRDALEAIPGLALPGTMTNPKILDIITRKTAVGLGFMGLTDLPLAGVSLDRLKDAVVNMSIIQVRRYLRPDDAQYLSALNGEERGILEALRQNLEDTSEHTGTWFSVVGGNAGD